MPVYLLVFVREVNFGKKRMTFTHGTCLLSVSSNHSLYLIKLPPGSSYPEGNFGGNQLLDGSIALEANAFSLSL
jgi:hypothetical protein